MSVSEVRARVKAKVWQAIAQSGVTLTTVPQEEMDRLVNSIADSVLEEVDEVLGEASGQAAMPSVAPSEGAAPEQTLWEGRPFLSIGVRYIITNERIRIVEGLLGKTWDDVELVRVQDIDKRQSATERMVNVGDILIRSANPSKPEIVLNNVKEPEAVHDLLRRAVADARARQRLSFREEM